MVVPFEELSNRARIWIYPSVQKLTPEVGETIKRATEGFAADWTAHGRPLFAACTIQHDHFLIVGAEEKDTSVSGCSIDASVRAVKGVEKLTGIRFSDNSNVAFLEDGRIFFIPFRKLREEFNRGGWTQNTLTFNPAINVKGALSTEWLIPSRNSWLKRYIGQTVSS